MAGSMMHFYNELARLDETVQRLFWQMGGLLGLFNLHSDEARRTSVAMKRDCFELLDRAGMSKELMRQAFEDYLVMQGVPRGVAVFTYDEAMHFYEMPERNLKELAALGFNIR